MHHRPLFAPGKRPRSFRSGRRRCRPATQERDPAQRNLQLQAQADARTLDVRLAPLLPLFDHVFKFYFLVTKCGQQ